jgi:hypothetical protein
MKTLVLALPLPLTAYAADKPPSQTSAVDIPALVRKTKPAVVQILTFDQDNKPLARGTGFFITPDGILLTNYYVITGAGRIIAKMTTGKAYPLKRICGYSGDCDVVLIRELTTPDTILNMDGSCPASKCREVAISSMNAGWKWKLATTPSAPFQSTAKRAPVEKNRPSCSATCVRLLSMHV